MSSAALTLFLSRGFPYSYLFRHHIIIVSKPLQSAFFLDGEQSMPLGRDLSWVRHDAMGFALSPSGSIQSAFEVSLWP